MPLLRITYHRGALTDAQKSRLAREVSPILLEGEVGRVIPEGMKLSYVLFQEVDPRSDWFVGGEPDLDAPQGGRFLFDIWYLEGASTRAEKSEIQRKMNEIIAKTVGVDGSFPNRLTDWVIVHEVPEGAWGASGVTVGIAAANEALGGSTSRAEYFERYLDAKKSVEAAHNFPLERA